MATDRPPTRAEVQALRTSVDKMTSVMAELVKTEVAEATVPRREIERRLRRSGQRVALALVAIVAIAAFLVAFNRATLQQAQRQAEQDLRRLVQVCRTTTPTISPADLAYCNSRVPGFTEARKRAAALAAEQVTRERRLRLLENQVEELRRRRR